MASSDTFKLTEVTTLSLESSLLSKSNGLMPLTLKKAASLPKDFILERNGTRKSTTRAMPKRQLRTYNPCLELYHDLPKTLNIKIGDCIGHGRSGYVFKVEPVGLAPDVPDTKLPPLVAKVARSGYNNWLLRETWFYEEMQSLQGIAIPWCYGLYCARISANPSELAFIPWVIGGQSQRTGNNDIDVEKWTDEICNFKILDEVDKGELEIEQDALKMYGAFREQHTDLVQQFQDQMCPEQSSTVVMVLILEEVGSPYLPMGGKNWQIGLPIPEDMKNEVLDVYGRIHELGIEHMDFKHGNILHAPVRGEEADEVAGNQDRDHRAYKCRIIDFELSRKIDFTSELLDSFAASYLRILAKNLPKGLDIGQNNVLG